MLLHVFRFRSAPNIQSKTPFHDLAPQTRLVCVLVSAFAIAFTSNGKWTTWGIYGLGILSLILLVRLNLLILLKRVALEFAFVALILLGTLFRQEGTVIWRWGFVQITTVGLIVLGSVTIKVLLSLLLLNILILTTPIPVLLQGLLILGIPPLLVAIMTAMYRYISVLEDSFLTMQRAAKSRNLMVNKATIRFILGNMIGSLFIRTYERGERVYQAMLARGYQGIPAKEKPQPLRKLDFFALTVTMIVLILGQLN